MESPNENINQTENLIVEDENNVEDIENQDKNEELNEAVNNKCVFISGIPYSTTEEELKEKFQTCGIIREIRMPKYQDSGRNIGYAHIYFKKNKAVKKVNIHLIFWP